MSPDPVEPELLDHLLVEFGDHGERAVGFLQTAHALLSLDSASALPRLPETIAYCLREAMKTIPASHPLDGGGLWRTASRVVSDARRRYELVMDVPGEDTQGALNDLLAAIDDLDLVHSQEGIHERRLITIMVNRTGALPVASGTTPIKAYQDLLRELDGALHGASTMDRALELWDRCAAILRQLFLPPDLRHPELELLAAIELPSVDEVAVTPVEAAAVTAAASSSKHLNLELLAENLATPDDLMSPLVITQRDVRDLIAGLHTLGSSNAGRMMFGDSTVTVDAETPYVNVDLSGHDDDTLRVLMVAVVGWITGLWGTDRLRPKVVIMDEFWRLLTDRATAEWAKHAFKMSRDHGASYIAVLQHLGDLRSVDEDTRAIAHGLLADSETRIVYRQPPDQAAALGELIGLTGEEISSVQRLVPGQALWRVGGRSTVVEHIVTDIERPLIDTNAAMGGIDGR